MTLVVDASVAMRWSFRMDGSDRAERLLRADEPLIAPDLIIAEFAIAAWKAAIFGTAPVDLVTDSVQEIESAFDELVPSVLLKDRALACAIELRHPVYDCFYLALAEMRDAEFITADGRLL